MNQRLTLLKLSSKSLLQLKNISTLRANLIKTTNYCLNPICRRHCSNNTADVSLYEILKVEKTASDEEIKSSFFRLSKLYHPDVNASEEAKKQWQDLNEAYNILGNERTRKLYDNGLLRPGGEFNIQKKGVRVYPAYERKVHPQAKKKKWIRAIEWDRKQIDQYNRQRVKDRFSEYVFAMEKMNREYYLERRRIEIESATQNSIVIGFIALFLIVIQVIYYTIFDEDEGKQVTPKSKKEGRDSSKKKTGSKLASKTSV